MNEPSVFNGPEVRRENVPTKKIIAVDYSLHKVKVGNI